MTRPDDLPPFASASRPPSQGPRILGLHHVTATVRVAQDDLDLHVGVLGLRLVKQTVNFDNPAVYHFYYGDAVGSPSTLMTTFPYEGTGVPPGLVGAGQVTRTRFSIPSGSLNAWRTRLEEAGLSLDELDPGGGAGSVAFREPSGLRYTLVEEGPLPGESSGDGSEGGPGAGRGDARGGAKAGSPGEAPTPAWPGAAHEGSDAATGMAPDSRSPWLGGGEPPVPPSAAIRGIHSVELLVRSPEASVTFARELLGLQVVIQEPGRVVMAPPDPDTGAPLAAPGALVEFRQAHPDEPDGVNGLGTVHHVALSVATDGELLGFRRRLLAAGVQVTEVRDRQYFRSIYFREPGGVLYEIATRGPGFTLDEPRDALGLRLQLPSWQEVNRNSIEARLDPIRIPGHG